MATTDSDSGDLETARLAADAAEPRREVEEPRGWAARLRQDKQFVVIAVLAVSGIGLVASLYIVPWGDSLGNRGIMMAGTWLFLVSGIVWLLASIAVIWWVAREEILPQWRWFKGVVRLSPKAHADMVDK